MATSPTEQHRSTGRSLRGRDPEDPIPSDQILGLDNIALELPIAGIGSRGLAVTFDYLCLTLLLFTIVAAVAFAADGPLDSGLMIGSLVLLVFFVKITFFLVQELAFKGCTLGKKMLLLRTVGTSGGTASTAQLIVRNLLRPIDLIVAAPLMALDPKARRLGDRLAGTLVIHDRPLMERASLGRVPAGWGPREVAVAESLLARRGELDPDQLRHLALRLVRLVQRDDPALLQESPVPEVDPVAALRQALAAS